MHQCRPEPLARTLPPIQAFCSTARCPPIALRRSILRGLGLVGSSSRIVASRALPGRNPRAHLSLAQSSDPLRAASRKSGLHSCISRLFARSSGFGLEHEIGVHVGRGVCGGSPLRIGPELRGLCPTMTPWAYTKQQNSPHDRVVGPKSRQCPIPPRLPDGS